MIGRCGCLSQRLSAYVVTDGEKHSPRRLQLTRDRIDRARVCGHIPGHGLIMGTTYVRPLRVRTKTAPRSARWSVLSGWSAEKVGVHER